MSADPLDSILYVVAGISVASGMPHPSSLKRQSGFIFFWYSWLFAACQAFAQNASRINPSLGAISQRSESITHVATETIAAIPAIPAIPNGKKEEQPK